jgi:glycosyltransferase involved in cell wall biosynthesis
MINIGLYLVENQKIGGAYQLCLNIISALKKLDTKKYRLTAFTEKNIWKKSLKNRFKIIHVKRNKFSKLATSLICKVSSNKKIITFFSNLFDPHINKMNKSEVDLIIFPTQDDNSYKTQKKSLSSILDLMHIYESQFAEYSKKEIKRRNTKYSLISKICDGILVESQLTIKHIFENYDVKSNIHVLPLLYPQYLNKKKNVNIFKKYNLPKEYIFYPAQFWEQKNHINLLKAFKIISNKYKNLNLVLSGAKKINYKNVLNKIDELKINDKIFLIDYIDENDMYSLYKKSKCVTYVPFTGPTNIPPLEAIKVGVPLVCSNVYSMKKQIGKKSALFVNPKSEKDISKKIDKILTSKKIRQKIIQSGKLKSKSFGIEKYAKLLEKYINITISN